MRLLQIIIVKQGAAHRNIYSRVLQDSRKGAAHRNMDCHLRRYIKTTFSLCENSVVLNMQKDERKYTLPSGYKKTAFAKKRFK